MVDSILNSVLAATVETIDGSRIDRFLAAHRPADAQRVWLELGPDDPLPDRRSLARRLWSDIGAIDGLLGAQLDAILHHPRLQRLEASWRGLLYLWRQIPEGHNIIVRVLPVTWKELAKDADRAIEFDQSQLFQKVYSAEFGTPGGKPYGVLLGDYAVRHRPSADDPVDGIGTLRAISQVAAAAFAPFVASVHPSFFGLDSFADLERPIDLQRIFRQTEYVKWNAFRESEDARFVGLTLPRVLMRRPYRDSPSRADGFVYREDVSARDRSAYLWGNAVYAFGGVLIRAFAQSGWLAGIRGVLRDHDDGGLVSGLTIDEFTTDSPGLVPKASTDVVVTDLREKELGELGFIPLCQCHDVPLAAFYGNQSVQNPKNYGDETARVNARLSAMLQYMFCVSRFAHYLKVMVRNREGTFSNEKDLESFLQKWLHKYTTADEDIPTDMQARYPLREGKVKVRELPGKPGSFGSVIHLRPHFQLDRMTTSVKLMTELLSNEN